MSTLEELEKYLVGEDGYLLNDDNNGKTVMLSGAWGSGKTHFWLEDVKPQLTEKNQKNIYISLYGRESISELKFEVLKEAYNLEVKDDIISKSASMLSSIAPSFGEKSLVDSFDKWNKKAKEKKAEEILKSGSIICLDDFERKSTKIDLNDLFGYISQLALDYKCKVVIILNSDVFEGEEANVFKTVKEKTVNKFFYFEPSIQELFDSIYKSDAKYTRLGEYKGQILSIIEETEELNARIYVQVLDNCLEWVDKGHDDNALRALVLNTICYVKNHFVLSYPDFITIRETNTSHTNQHVSYDELRYEHEINKFFRTTFTVVSLKYKDSVEGKVQNFFKDLNEHITGVNSNKERIRITQEMQKLLLDEIDEKYDEMQVILEFGYRLFVAKDIEKPLYEEVSIFIKSGILPLKDSIL